MQVKKVAALAVVVTVLAVVIEVWKDTPAALKIVSQHPDWRWWIIPVIVLGLFFAAILPLFYISLYRYEGTFCLPPRFRLLSRVAALVLAVAAALKVPQWIASLGTYLAALNTIDWRTGGSSVWSALQAPGTINQIESLVGVVWNVAYILLLIALSRKSIQESFAEVPDASLLSWVSKVTIVSWSLLSIYTLVGIVYLPYVYFQFRREMGPSPPGLAALMAAPIHRFVFQVSVIVAPYVVFRKLQEIDEDRIYAAYGESAAGRIAPGQL